MPEIKKIVLVGHCMPDTFMLKSTVSRYAPDATIEAVNDQAALDEHADNSALLLINRELDGDFDAQDGVALIKQQTGKDNAPTALLISNYAEYQEKAQQAGGVEGFGKSELGEKGKQIIHKLVGRSD